MADINSKILEALNQGVGPEDIINHLSRSKDPDQRAWVANYQSNMIAREKERDDAPIAAVPTGPDISGVQALGGAANQMAGAYAKLPMTAQLAIPAAVAAGGYVGAKAVNLGFETLKEKLKANQEVKTQAALNALPPSAAVQVQQQQLALQQAEQANRFAQQGTAGPTVNALEQARVATETQRAATETARTEAAKVQAALAQEKLIAAQRKQAMVKVNPAAQAAAAEALPAAAQITPAAKPSIAQLQQILDAKGSGAIAPAAAPAPVALPATPDVTSVIPAAAPAPVLSPEEIRQQRLKAAAVAAQQQMIPGAVAPSPVADNATTNVISGTTAAAPAAPAAPAPTVVETITPPIQTAITNDPLATPEAKAEARVNAPETPAAVNRYDVTTPADGVTNVPSETITPVSEIPKTTPIEGAVEPKTLLTGTGKVAYVGEGPMPKERWKSSYPDVQSIPKGYAFVPGAQAINTVRQNVGQEPFTKYYTKNPYPASYEEALQQGRDINKSMGRMTRDEMKAAGIDPPPATPGIGKIIGSTKQRLINVGIGGAKVAGMAVAISDLANAQSLSQAGESLGNIAINAVPGIGPGAALYSGSAAAPTLTETNLPLEVRKNLETMRQNLSPEDYAKLRTSYLNNVMTVGLPPTSRERLLSNLQSGYQARPAANTLLPVRPPR